MCNVNRLWITLEEKTWGTSTRHINNQCVYNLVSNIPPGKVATYGQLASSVWESSGGTWNWKNLEQESTPNYDALVIVLCVQTDILEVICAGKERKISLLLNEGIPIVNDLIKDFEKYRV